jgi:putative transposase
MTAPDSVNPASLLRERPAIPDLLRAILKTFAEALMSAEAHAAACGAGYGQ